MEQVMFVRMGITLLLGSVYMWWAQVDQYPFGPKEVRNLLLARGFGGFFGRMASARMNRPWLTFQL